MTDGGALAETYRLDAKEWEAQYKNLHRQHQAMLEALMCLGPRRVTKERIGEILHAIENVDDAKLTTWELYDLINVAMKVIYLTERETKDGTSEGS